MTTHGMNIYKEARQRAHMTVEAAAELLNIAPRSLQHYEAGDRAVPDDVVADMIGAYNTPFLGYLHLRSNAVGKMVLPDVCETGPARCAIKTTLATEEVPAIARKMLTISEDDRIDSSERNCFRQIQGAAVKLAAAFLSICFVREKENAVRRPTERRIER